MLFQLRGLSGRYLLFLYQDPRMEFRNILKVLLLYGTFHLYHKSSGSQRKLQDQFPAEPYSRVPLPNMVLQEKQLLIPVYEQ